MWLDSVLPEYKAVANFRGEVHTGIVNEFKKLDKYQFTIAKARVRSNLINTLPAIGSMVSGRDEISILKRELNKSRRIMPIRKLFSEIPNLIKTLKPCLMMSPLTVSLFLESDAFKFDTVIFDEASQVCTENAIGAILRGKQVIIAGDSKQLPPTNFFKAALSNSDYDEYDEDDEVGNDVFESLLDEAALLPSKTLLWHYRSRHEHLIAFSNAKIYNNNLITFPSSTDSGEDVGVQYEYVPAGFYDRGGRKGNVIEASKVADMVFEHFAKCSSGVFNRSLGVITFGEVQAQAVEAALRQKRLQHPEYEEYFNEEIEEAFFVKSLENVQGDERDTIIFSIGYAKDKQGVMRMAFGPLSQNGGERRLNVAITRAKHNVKLVGSILPTDIDVDRVSTDGPKLLKAYIDFAQRGMVALESEINESEVLVFDSPFEESVYNVLLKNGFIVRTQVGCSSYRIDLGVKHPDIPGVFVLGVECDGASYHSAKTARERDRLRQDVLESMGWRIYRIWSTDWIKDHHTEGRRLVDAVHKAIAEYGTDTKMSSDIPVFSTKPLIKEGEKPDPIKDAFADYIAPKFDYKETLENNIFNMINQGYPIHEDLLYQACCSYFDRTKVTSVVKDKVNSVLSYLKIRNRIIEEDGFYYPKDYSQIPLRVAGVRSAEYISIPELQNAICKIAQLSIGIDKDGLLLATANALGFKRRGPAVKAQLEEAFDRLVSSKKITFEDGKIVLK